MPTTIWVCGICGATFTSEEEARKHRETCKPTQPEGQIVVV
jgi:hypothetical protein